MDDIPLIFIVDDDNAIREFLATVIEKMDYRTASAPDGEKALEYLDKNPHPDLILLDVIMPGMNGIELLRKIKERPSLAEIIVIMVTGIGHITEKELAFKLGANDYLVKPFDPRELAARIKTHINLKKTTEHLIIQKKIQDKILSTVPGIVYFKDQNGTYIHGNERFAEITGVEIENIEGKTDHDLFSALDAEQRLKTDELILKMGIPELEMEEELQISDGVKRVFLTRKSQVLNERNEVSGLVGVSIDMTEQVILKEAYSEKDELLTIIIDSCPAEVWVINQEREVILQNSQHLMRFGTLIGESAESLSPPGISRDSWSDTISNSLNGEVIICETDQTDNNESVRFFECLGPLKSSGMIHGVIGIRGQIPGWERSNPETETITRCIQALVKQYSQISENR